MGVLRCDLGTALAQRFLYDAQIFCLLVEIRAAAVSEQVAGIAGLFESRTLQRTVDDIADADACNAPFCVVA